MMVALFLEKKTKKKNGNDLLPITVNSKKNSLELEIHLNGIHL